MHDFKLSAFNTQRFRTLDSAVLCDLAHTVPGVPTYLSPVYPRASGVLTCLHSSQSTVLIKRPPNTLSTNVCFTSRPYSAQHTQISVTCCCGSQDTKHWASTSRNTREVTIPDDSDTLFFWADVLSRLGLSKERDNAGRWRVWGGQGGALARG